MPSTGSTIESNVKAFAKAMTKFLNDKRAAKVVSLSKAAAKNKKSDTSGANGKGKTDDDPGAQLVTAYFVLSTRKVTQKRSPEAQAVLISNKKSWTCASAHMIDMARHVDLMYGPPGKSAKISWDLAGAFGSKPHHFATLAEVKTKWNALMKTHALKNFAGGDGWSDKDSFHFELAESKVPRSDPIVGKCLASYAHMTRVDGRQRNPSFENGSWKAALAPYLKKAEAEKQAAELALRQEALRKLRFDGKVSGKQVLLKGGNKTTTVSGKSFGVIDPSTDEDIGAMVIKKSSVGATVVWDSLGRSIFEKLGLLETKGFDVKLDCAVTYATASNKNLSQTFLQDVTPTCAVIYNTPAAFAMKLNVTAIANISLAKSAKGPSGTVTFQVELTSPIDRETASVVVTMKDGKATAARKK